ncbi:MAG: DUF3021 domain-containing protein [Methanobrevibacter sp.]|jgi:hypothetical protein|nr:DUF3021 domain-containing protein [Candidatus Methanoflexus mossambicus]
MDIVKICKLIFLGASTGCLVISLVELLMILSIGINNFYLNGYEIVNLILGGIVVGLVFSLSSFIYEKEDLSTLIQTTVQMGLGFIALFIVGIYLQWIPLNEGLNVIVNWIIIALIIGFIFWGGFYIYFKIEAKKINQRLKKMNQ